MNPQLEIYGNRTTKISKAQVFNDLWKFCIDYTISFSISQQQNFRNSVFSVLLEKKRNRDGSFFLNHFLLQNVRFPAFSRCRRRVGLVIVLQHGLSAVLPNSCPEPSGNTTSSPFPLRTAENLSPSYERKTTFPLFT